MDNYIKSIAKYLEGNKAITLMTDLDVIKGILNDSECYVYQGLPNAEPFEKKFLIFQELEAVEKEEGSKFILRGYIKVIDRDNAVYAKRKAEAESSLILDF